MSQRPADYDAAKFRREIFYLKRRERISPHTVRIALSNAAQDVAAYAGATPGVNNKIFIPPPGHTEVHIPDFDFARRRWLPQPGVPQPDMRTFTHRGIDVDKGELYLDFALHPHHGPASLWAQHAPVGAPLGMALYTGAWPLHPPAQQCLLVADLTGLPAIACILTALPADTSGTVLIEIPHAADQQNLSHPPGVALHWLVHPTPGQHSPLAANTIHLLADMPPAPSRFAYIAAELASVKTLRQHLYQQPHWHKSQINAFAYWRHGVAERHSEAARRAERDGTG